MVHVKGEYGAPPAAAAPRSQGSNEERKQRVLTHGTPSVTASIAEAVVIKDGDLFLLTRVDGGVPREAEHGFGLYFHDCRFLRTYEITLCGERLVPLGNTAAPGNRAAFELTNPDLEVADGQALKKEELGVRWEHRLSGGGPAMDDQITVQNWSHQAIALSLEFRFDAQFEDIYEVRGLLTPVAGRGGASKWKDQTLSFRRQGRDGRVRRVTITFSGGAEATGDTTARVRMKLGPRERGTLSLRLVAMESAVEGEGAPAPQVPRGSPDAPERRRTEVRSDSVLLNGILDRSFEDLHLLASDVRGDEFFAAGLPWFATLFGRDSIISSIQMLGYDPTVAESTLRLLASLQGDRVDRWRDEEPGKILHELRVGELVRAGEIPHSPYYGTVDATPLFLVLLARHAEWTGDLALFHELELNVERALDWIATYGDSDGDGYVEYRSSSEHGLINQGWKDSGDAIIDARGRIATPPIALVEVQGYVYAAKLAVAGLWRRAGRTAKAEALEAEAAALRAAFNRDFWLPDMGCYALALEADKRPLGVVSSNPGHLLWSGIADREKADLTASRLMTDDMFSGWGIRTLSTEERGYNPIGYHLGTVWPHDNSIVAAGFKRYGYENSLGRVFNGIAEAAMHFEHSRLPELFTGFSQRDYDEPIRYPVACHPQAWASGAVPFLLMSLLGVQPDAFARRLRIVRPALPSSADFLELRGLQVGQASVDLRFERSHGGDIAVRTLDVQGELAITVEPADGLVTPSEHLS